LRAGKKERPKKKIQHTIEWPNSFAEAEIDLKEEIGKRRRRS